ncbi:MAG: VOC family protein [Acidobacteriaceae bacterium]
MTTTPATTFDFGIQPPAYRLPANARIGRIRLAVSNLSRSIDFYTRIIGLRILSSQDSLASLAPCDDNRILLELQQLPGVQPIQPGSRLGLYHPAFLLPTREDLGRFVRHLHRHDVPFGAGDHLYSEALYLTDPDGLTVEVYADRDRSTWKIDGRELVSATNPVRLGELAALSTEPWEGLPAATTIGHVHFYVGNLKQAASFYHDALGLDLITWRYPGALFLSAGGYHHHVAVNTWAAGSPPASETDARLLFWELALPSFHDISRAATSLRAAGIASISSPDGAAVFTDPWGIRVVLVT